MYKHAALGGTFDHFHIGHEYIIDFALKRAEKISIGISSSELYANKDFSNAIQTYTYRKQTVERYLESRNSLQKVTIFRLDTIYGTTLTDATLDCIVVTDETIQNAHIINHKRKNLSLPELKIIKCPFVIGQDEKVIRSTNIRNGHINRAGFPYSYLFYTDILYLNSSLRKKLQKPLNKPIFKENELNTAILIASKLKKSESLTIAVGDIVSKTLHDIGFTPELQIVDYKTRRKNIIDKSIDRLSEQYRNDPGTLYKNAVNQIDKNIQEIIQNKVKKIIVIDGEEDLLALPAILLAPLHSVVLYGQFDQGIVMVTVTEKIKEKVADLVRQFTSSP